MALGSWYLDACGVPLSVRFASGGPPWGEPETAGSLVFGCAGAAPKEVDQSEGQGPEQCTSQDIPGFLGRARNRLMQKGTASEEQRDCQHNDEALKESQSVHDLDGWN